MYVCMHVGVCVLHRERESERERERERMGCVCADRERISGQIKCVRASRASLSREAAHPSGLATSAGLTDRQTLNPKPQTIKP
jgi:hypothetical protein